MNFAFIYHWTPECKGEIEKKCVLIKLFEIKVVHQSF